MNSPNAANTMEPIQASASDSARTVPLPVEPDEYAAALVAGVKTLVDACVHNEGSRLGYLSTAFTVRDIDELRAALGFPDRGLQERSDFTGINWADVPVILVEMGFITNPTEDRLLVTPAYQRRAAIGLCRGTLGFLGRPATGCG